MKIKALLIQFLSLINDYLKHIFKKVLLIDLCGSNVCLFNSVSSQPLELSI